MQRCPSDECVGRQPLLGQAFFGEGGESAGFNQCDEHSIRPAPDPPHHKNNVSMHSQTHTRLFRLPLDNALEEIPAERTFQDGQAALVKKRLA